MRDGCLYMWVCESNGNDCLFVCVCVCVAGFGTGKRRGWVTPVIFMCFIMVKVVVWNPLTLSVVFVSVGYTYQYIDNMTRCRWVQILKIRFFIFSLFFFLLDTIVAVGMAVLVVTPLWYWLKCVNNSEMDRHETLYRHSWSPEEEAYWHLMHHIFGFLFLFFPHCVTTCFS